LTTWFGSWTKPRKVIAKVEWHPGELVPRVGFIVTNLSRSAERVVAFYNQRGTAEQWIKEGKGAIKWTRLSCRTFVANAVRLQLHALAYNLGNFLRTLATPEPIKDWSLTSLKEKLIKIGAKVVSHGRYIAFQMAEVAISRTTFAEVLRLIAELRPPPDPAPAWTVRSLCLSAKTTGQERLDEDEIDIPGAESAGVADCDCKAVTIGDRSRRHELANARQWRQAAHQQGRLSGECRLRGNNMRPT
jgi:hypothetical protein